MNQYKKVKIILAGFLILAAITFFLPLADIMGITISMFQIVKTAFSTLEFADTGGYLEDMLGITIEPAAALLLSIPYIICLLAALAAWFAGRKGSCAAGILGGGINFAIFLGVALLLNQALNQSMGGGFFGMEISVWEMLGTGFWAFLVLNAAAIVTAFYMLKAVPKESGPEEEEEDGEMDLEEPALPTEEPVRSETVGFIRGLSGEYAGTQLTMHDNDTITIGRDPGQCNLVVAGSRVSRRHCSIRFHADTNLYTLTDFSTNGTYYADGRQIQPNTSVELMPGTGIYLGNRDNSFQLG